MSYCKECRKAIADAWQLLLVSEPNPDMNHEECAEMIAYDNGWTCASRGEMCGEEEDER